MAAELDFDARALTPVYILHLVTSVTLANLALKTEPSNMVNGL
jgi:hypothetical protein